ncbi:tRNA (adenosine(37)-N6)-threonylcarbamoyltransferase complex transferase subunit TsaD [Candidatus Woesebacteria bacterium]|nr:tRNA (adenosine(37)-N6)-threonylcarbamoyltransferase complex transferase subunit TsaD [Candidatus Woesebacteria bacterium]
MKYPIVLAIDTSCDDTSAAVTCGLEIWSNVIASQTELHRPYGGVFPTVAKQAHKENIEAVVKLALQRAGVLATDIDQIAATVGPGLAPALEVGITYGQKLAAEWGVPLQPVNHIEGHLLSVLAIPRQLEETTKHTYKIYTELKLPALAVIVSGGHTEFVLVSTPRTSLRQTQGDSAQGDRQPRLTLIPNPKEPMQAWLNSGRFMYELLGQTVDDAAGEALDKIGRMLNLGYPAGPVVEQLAKLGNPQKYEFPLPMTTTHDFNLSFSGMKTFARRFIETNWSVTPPTKQEIYDFCASLQYSIFRHICYKLNKVLLKYPNIQSVWLGGGVAANVTLRKMLRQTLRSLPHQQRHLTLKTPYTKRLCMDNAGMIGIT